MTTGTKTGRSPQWHIGKFRQGSSVPILSLTLGRGEKGVGKWTVVVKDATVNEFSGKFIDWRLNLWGEAIDGSKQGLLPMPSEHDDDDHDATTTTASVHTTSVQPGVEPSGDVEAKPSDHQDRPINQKPTPTEVPADTTAAATVTVTSTAVPTPTTPARPDSFLPSFFPTFGVSKRTQVWIYGAFTLIVIFCAALGVYYYIQRKKRLRNDVRDNYEFERLTEAADEPGTTGGAGGRKPRRRGGELYDAFAGESDEELFSDEDDEPYKDRDEEQGLISEKPGSHEADRG